MERGARVRRLLDIAAIVDPVDRRNAATLQAVLLVIAALPPALWLYRIALVAVPWRPGETMALAGSLAVSAIAVACLVLARVGRFRPAVGMLLVVVAAMQLLAYATGGIVSQSHVMPIQVMWLFVAGMMLGRRALWLMLAAMVAGFALGGFAEMRITGEPALQAFGDAFVRAAMFALVAAVVDRGVAALRAGIDEARARGEALAAANVRLHAEIAARERAQALLLHAQKVEAVGRLAGGLAHDFGHLLTLVDGYTERAATAVDEDERTAALAGVRAASARAAAQVRRLMHFSRDEPAHPQAFDAGEALRELAPLLEQTLGPGIRMAFAAPEKPTPLYMDRDQFGLVLLNLAANAAEAMPDGGRFSLRARTGDGRLELLVGDSGPGVPDAVRSRIFDAFFTTKSADRGTGLGLAVSRDLVEAAGGSLGLEPRGDLGGAQFRLELPLDERRARVAA